MHMHTHAHMHITSQGMHITSQGMKHQYAAGRAYLAEARYTSCLQSITSSCWGHTHPPHLCCLLMAVHGALIDPTGALVNFTGALVNPTGALVNPIGALVNPTGALVNPTGALVSPTRALVSPSAAWLSMHTVLLHAANNALRILCQAILVLLLCVYSPSHAVVTELCCTY